MPFAGMVYGLTAVVIRISYLKELSRHIRFNLAMMVAEDFLKLLYATAFRGLRGAWTIPENREF